MAALKQLAQEGHTVICSIHQVLQALFWVPHVSCQC